MNEASNVLHIPSWLGYFDLKYADRNKWDAYFKSFESREMKRQIKDMQAFYNAVYEVLK